MQVVVHLGQKMPGEVQISQVGQQIRLIAAVGHAALSLAPKTSCRSAGIRASASWADAARMVRMRRALA